MGKPTILKDMVSVSEHIRYRRERRELKHLSTYRKRKKKSIFKVVASEMERAQTESSNIRGVWTA